MARLRSGRKRGEDCSSPRSTAVAVGNLANVGRNLVLQVAAVVRLDRGARADRERLVLERDRGEADDRQAVERRRSEGERAARAGVEAARGTTHQRVTASRHRRAVEVHRDPAVGEGRRQVRDVLFRS